MKYFLLYFVVEINKMLILIVDLLVVLNSVELIINFLLFQYFVYNYLKMMNLTMNVLVLLVQLFVDHYQYNY